MATESAAAAIENNHRNGMVKRLSVISMSFLERLLKTAGPYDHDQWPPEPTIGPINPGMLTKIAKQASEEYLTIMTNSGRDALAEFDGLLLRQVLKAVVFENLSVSRRSRRATTTTSPTSHGSAAAADEHQQHQQQQQQQQQQQYLSDSPSSSPGITPRDYHSLHHVHQHRAPAGVHPLPLSAAGVVGTAFIFAPSSSSSPFFNSARSVGGVTTSTLGASRFMALHPVKAEAMIAAKRMLDPLLTTSKFPREAYKAVVLDVGDQFMDRFHAKEQFHHVNRLQQSREGDNQPLHQQDQYALTIPEREWITDTVLSAISRIVVNEDGSIFVNGRVIAFPPTGVSGLSSYAASRGGAQPLHGAEGRGGGGTCVGGDGSFLKQLQRLRTILQQEESDANIPSVSVDEKMNNTSNSHASPGPSPSAYRAPTLNSPQQISSSSASSSAHREKPYRERVYCILAKYAPNRIDKVNKYMEQYQGHEEELIAALVEKYGAEPVGDAPVEIDVPPVAAATADHHRQHDGQHQQHSSRGESSLPSISQSPRRREELEHQIANIQYQMSQMQSQLQACQKELKTTGDDDNAVENGQRTDSFSPTEAQQ